MEPKAKRAYIISSVLSVVLLGVFLTLYFTDILAELWYLVGVAIAIMLANVILFIWFARVREKEREEIHGKEFQPYKP